MSPDDGWIGAVGTICRDCLAGKEHDAKQPGTTRDTLRPRNPQLTSTTRGPSTSIRGVVPSPGAVPAHRTPFSRYGAPVAVLTVT
jgi:hypothetical protein